MIQVPGMNQQIGVGISSSSQQFSQYDAGNQDSKLFSSTQQQRKRKYEDIKDETYAIVKKRLRLNKEDLDCKLIQLYTEQSDISLLEVFTIKKRAPSLTQFLQNHSCKDPEEVLTNLEKECAVKLQQQQQSKKVTQPEIKLAGGVPVAISTTLPPAVARLSQQGGTSLDPTCSDRIPTQKLGPGRPSTVRLDQDQIAEKAKQEAYVLQRVAQLQREGLWFEKRLPKVVEPTRTKAHWDYLLEEMQWLATDFAQERKWKKAMARKIARAVQKHFQEKKQQQLKAEKAAEQNARKIASFMARGVKQFWTNVGKLVEFKQTTMLEEKRKQALDQHLSFIVGETEKFSTLVAESMNKPALDDQDSSSHVPSDGEFHPDGDSTDDEETIEKEEKEVKNTVEQAKEIELLQKESELSLDDILDQLPPGYLEARLQEIEGEKGGPSTSKVPANVEDEGHSSDFTADDDESEEDDEETLAEQENAEGDTIDHDAEMKELEADNELSIEELKAKYAAPPPSVSASSSAGGNDQDEEMDSVDEDEDLDSDDEEGEEEDDNLTGSEDDSDAELSTNDKEHGLSSLLTNPSGTDSKDADKKMNDVAALAESIQPKGYTLSSTSVVTPVPFMLQFPLREYQHVGLDWLVTMFERNLNGILADEMGLGKTIQTIALLAHLACEKGIWGPHLIVVPTSVMLNWEMELKKWCPAFKVLTYYGSIKERRQKRTGWTKPNTFHVCITSYKLVIQDCQSFRRKKWRYLILDEAQNIKNFKSQRWQLLLNFNTERRLLLTGTPLQNNLNELWSLMHFLMPSLFQSHSEFQNWFSLPMKDMIEGNTDINENIVKRLHKVLRPFLLRRLKCEVEKQLPKKYEHVVMCRLSNRQKYLYDDFMSRTKTKETLANGTMLSVINILMQLRKVCNHPNLFEERATISPFHMEPLVNTVPSIVFNALNYDVFKHIDFRELNLNLLYNEMHVSLSEGYNMQRLKLSAPLIEQIDSVVSLPPPMPKGKPKLRVRCKDPRATVRVVIVNNTKSVRTQGINIGNILVRQIICQSGVQGLTVRPTSTSAASVNSTTSSPTVQGIPVQLVQRDGSRSTIKFLTGAPRVIVQKSATGQVTSLIKLPAVISQSSTSSTPGTATISSPSSQQTVQLLASAMVPSSNVANKKPTTTPSTTTNTTSSLSSSIISSSPSVGATAANNEITSSTALATAGQVTTRRKQNLTSTCHVLDHMEQQLVTVFIKPSLQEKRLQRRKAKLRLLSRVNDLRCAAPHMLYGDAVRDACSIFKPVHNDFVLSYEQRVHQLEDMFKNFLVYVPSVTAPLVQLRVCHPHPSTLNSLQSTEREMNHQLLPKLRLLHPVTSAMSTQFPDPRLIQYDCGKLQSLDIILRKLKIGGHRVLIFTQMTRMLDVLEAFLNYHGHIYLRLDGTTKVDQRQFLMERFNKDPRIFCFILSTRSGGVGVNLTGADTVIFYDSDWNPTMDAQAQDRCHRIGQTRDVHIYRLISEKTIEENILKKANQKRLLSDIAIENGQFTTAFFKSSTIQDLFTVDKNEHDAAKRMADVLEPSGTNQLDKASLGVLETALAAAEDATDVAAAKCAKAELVADMAEFDETIPVTENPTEQSKAEQEVNMLMEQLSVLERWAINFYEDKIVSNAELVAQAEAELEQQKKDWEMERIAAVKREEQRRRELKLESRTDLLTYSREDSQNQVWIGSETSDLMPIWSPPTPPQDDNDVYIDFSLMMLYEAENIPESQLPPAVVKKDKKRIRTEVGVDGQPLSKIRHREDVVTNVPRSLFDRPSPQLVKMRHDIRMQKYRGIPRPVLSSVPSLKPPVNVKPVVPEPDNSPEWLIHEDMLLLQAVLYLELHPNLIILAPAHIPNWDLVAEIVNQVSRVYRSPKSCQNRYESVLIPREEGKVLQDSSPKKNKPKNKLHIFTKIPQVKSGRAMRTQQLYIQDNNTSNTTLMVSRYETIRAIINRRTPTTQSVKPLLMNSQTNKKLRYHAEVLTNSQIAYDQPLTPIEVAHKLAERLAKEKQATAASRATPEQLALLQQRRAEQQAAAAAAAQQQHQQVSATQPQTVQLIQHQQQQQVQPQQTLVQQIQSQQPTQQMVHTQATVVQTQAVRQVMTPTTIRTQGGTVQQQRTVNVADLLSAQVRSQSVVNASSAQQVQQIRTSNVTSAVVMSSSAQPIVASRMIAGTPTTTKTISQAQLALYQKQQQLRNQQQIKMLTQQQGRTVHVAGVNVATGSPSVIQAANVQVSQSTSPVTIRTQAKPRTVTDSEVAAILKHQILQQQQHQPHQVVTIQQQTKPSTSSAVGTILAQASQAGTGQVATLVKTIPAQTAGANIASILPQVKTLNPAQLKTTQFRQLQQQLMNAKRMTAAGGTPTTAKVVKSASGHPTQLIVQKTMQQIQQVIKQQMPHASAINVSNAGQVISHAVITKSAHLPGGQRVIPGSPKLQVVTAGTGQVREHVVRPGTIKVASTAQQQALLSQVTAALQQGQSIQMRSSPVRITSGGQPIVAVAVSQPQQIQQHHPPPNSDQT